MHHGLQLQDVFRRKHVRGDCVGFGEIAQDVALAGRIRVADAQPHEEAIELRFGQRICAVVLDRVLRGDHHKGRGQRVGTTIDGDLALVHGFEQRGLRLGRGAVDFVGQKKIREDRTRLKFESLGMHVVNRDTQHIAGQHVAGELKPVKTAIHRARQRLRQCGFSNARHVFDEKVPSRQQADERKPHGFGLAADGRSERRLERSQFRKGDGRSECDRRGLHDFPLGH